MNKFKKFASILMLTVAVVFAAGCTKPEEPVPGGGDTPEEPTIPTGAIDGLFTINDHGGKVYFSQGNLQYQASTNTWRFAKHQWNYIGGSDCYGVHYGNVEGSTNSLVSSTYDGWIDYFGFGASGWDNGNLFYHGCRHQDLQNRHYTVGSNL